MGAKKKEIGKTEESTDITIERLNPSDTGKVFRLTMPKINKL